jgi:hypothetical protein
MCEKCIQTDRKIEGYGLTAAAISDQPTIDLINEIIADLRAQKIALHSDRAPEAPAFSHQSLENHGR